MDSLFEMGNGFDVIECKSGQTQASEGFTAINRWMEKTKQPL